MPNVLVVSNIPTPYNDALFGELARQPGIELRETRAARWARALGRKHRGLSIAPVITQHANDALAMLEIVGKLYQANTPPRVGS